MRNLAVLCLGALAALAAPADAGDRTTVADLLSSPSAYADRDVVVEGVASESRWASMTVMGNPPFQGWYRMFLLQDGAVAIWVVMVNTGQGPPQPGVPIEIGGVFRATSRAIEMDRAIRYRQ